MTSTKTDTWFDKESGLEYIVVNLCPAIKQQDGTWEAGVEYVPVVRVPGAPNHYVRTVSNFTERFERRNKDAEL